MMPRSLMISWMTCLKVLTIQVCYLNMQNTVKNLDAKSRIRATDGKQILIFSVSYPILTMFPFTKYFIYQVF